MQKFFPCVIAMIVLAAPLASMGNDLPADEKKFFDDHIAAVVKIVPTRLADPAMLKVFSAPFYDVKINIAQGDGSETAETIVARSDDKLVSVARPSSDADVPEMLKMIDSKFKLASEDDAKTLQQALDAAYPIPSFSDSDVQAKAFNHTGTTWNFIRGVFFKNHMGFVFETDASGKITSIKFSLKIP